jgi:predicted nucleic acid-binding protein
MEKRLKILFDTNVLVAALIQPHPMHSRAFQWLKRAKTDEFILVISSHTIAELYAVLTSLPVSPKITPDMAWKLIHENILSNASIVSLLSSDYVATIKHLIDLGLYGGIVYDALILKSALKSGTNKLLTFNVSDFRRISQDDKIQIIEP